MVYGWGFATLIKFDINNIQIGMLMHVSFILWGKFDENVFKISYNSASSFLRHHGFTSGPCRTKKNQT